jgi:hypothetical protein
MYSNALERCEYLLSHLSILKGVPTGSRTKAGDVDMWKKAVQEILAEHKVSTVAEFEELQRQAAMIATYLQREYKVSKGEQICSR